MNRGSTIAIVLAAAALAGCTTTSAPLANGDSLRALVAAQTHDPDAGQRNGVQLPEPTDADRAVAAIGAMREGVGKSKETWTTTIVTGGVGVTGQ